MSATHKAPSSNGHKLATKKTPNNGRAKDPPHPALTSATTPAGIAARQGLHPQMAATLAEETHLPLHVIHPHPDNRKLSDDDADVLELAASLDADGLLQAITVRAAPEHWDLPKGHYQLVDGERRWRAARVAGLKTIRSKVRDDLSDAEAKALLAVANAQRKDLNAIEKSKLIQQLCTANEDGSPPLTRDQAAHKIGLETGAAASNLVRLLELPKPWQDRVASGELPWTWAREMLSIVKLEPVLKQLEEDFRRRDTADRWERNAFHSRQQLVETIDDIVGEECRPLEDLQQELGKKRQFTDDERAKLEIVEVELPTGKRGQTKAAQLVTNLKYAEELCDLASDDRSKASAEKSGRDEPPAKRELSAAEQKKKAAERSRLLAERIEAWRHKLLRRGCIDAIDLTGDSGVRIILAHAADVGRPYGTLSFDQALAQTVGRTPGSRLNWWPVVAPVVFAMQGGEDYTGSEEDVLPALAKHILAHETDDWRRPTLPHELVEGYATALGVDVAGEWVKLQATQVSDSAARQALLEEFYLLHQTAELQALAAELGVHLLASVKSRPQIVQVLLGKPRLPLPKSIKPLATAGGKRKGAKSAKAARR